jgi:hypothetical protein
MAKMNSTKASQVKVSGELAKHKLSQKLNATNPKNMFLTKATNSQICEAIGTEGKVMLRAGKNWQFHLGEINEISTIEYYSNSIEVIPFKNKNISKGSHSESWENQLKFLSSKLLWEKYFAKGNDVLCFSSDNFEYFFFNIKEIIDFLISNIKWRLLESGRIKGDIILSDNDLKTIFTIEFRNESHKKCFAFGAHGGNKGIELFLILLRNIKHYHCNL